MSWLDRIERAGNRLPDPVTLFVLGATGVLLLSALGGALGWSATHPRTDEVIAVTSLLSAEGAQWAWTHLVSNFTGFAPLGIVLTAVLGLGVAERSGLLGALLDRSTRRLPPSLLVPGVLFLGVMSSMTVDAGFVVLPPLAAVVFAGAGRAPVLGVYLSWAAVSGGFSANLLVTALDPMLSGATQQAAQLIDPNAVVPVTANYYFMVVSTFLIVGLAWFVTVRWVEPRFSAEDIRAQIACGLEAEDDGADAPAPSERALVAALLSAFVLVAGLGWALLPGGSLHGELQLAPGVALPIWARALVPIIFVVFVVPGIVYGAVAGTIRSDRDVARMMTESMAGLGSYLVLAFFCAQFVSWFGHSGLGTVMALRGIQLLAQLGLPQILLVLALVGVTGFLNLFIGSASAKWFLLAPVFVPLLMGLGISPELSQAAFRVGDSATNIIAPLNPYTVVAIIYARRWVPSTGLGTLISAMVPFAIAYLIGWTILLSLWIGLDLPLGPNNGPLFIDPL